MSTTPAVRCLIVDLAKCQGHNRCYELAPELIDVDDLGKPVVRGDGVVPSALEDKARLAVKNCPEYALRLVEPGSPGQEG
ncbi:MAG TPA: ferredoxin [Hyphomicrobiaceae bacterium]|nr:ferredoxin [Hyphomicrobiaceae bacterium]